MKKTKHIHLYLHVIVVFIVVFISSCAALGAISPDKTKPLRTALQQEAGPLDTVTLPQNGPQVDRYFKDADRHAHDYHFSGSRIIGTINTTEFIAGVVLLLPKTEPYKGVIIAFHGYSSYSAYHLPALYKIAEEGWAVLAVDLPGHGFTSGYPGGIDDFSQYAEFSSDIIDWTVHQNRYNLPKPVILLGHSTGGSTILENIWTSSPDIDCAVLLAPLLYLKNFPALSCLASSLDPFIYSGVTGPNKQGYLSFEEFPLYWVSSYDKWQKTLKEKSVISLPMLIIQGNDDNVLDWEKNLLYMKKKFNKADIKILYGRGHVLLNHKEAQEESLELIIPFLEKRSAKHKTGIDN